MNIENKSLDQGKRSVSAMHNCRYLFIWVNFNRTLEFEVGYNPCYIYTLKKQTYKEKSKAWKQFWPLTLQPAFQNGGHTERVKIFNQFQGKVDQQAIKLQFINKIHRNGPPWKEKCKWRKVIKVGKTLSLCLVFGGPQLIQLYWQSAGICFPIHSLKLFYFL